MNGFVCRRGIQTEAIVLAAQRQSSQICRCSTYREQNRKMDFMSKQSCRLPEPKKQDNQDMLKLSLWLPIQQGDAQCNSETECVKYNACKRNDMVVWKLPTWNHIAGNLLDTFECQRPSHCPQILKLWHKTRTSHLPPDSLAVTPAGPEMVESEFLFEWKH